jgi:hypothetical protein
MLKQQRNQRRAISGLLGLLIMSSLSYVDAAWVNVTNNLAGIPCAPAQAYCVAAVPGHNKVILGICGNVGLYATTDNGASWQAMGSSQYWADPQSIVFDKENPDIFWECGIHGGAVHKTTDGGKTFTILSGSTGGGSDGIGVDMTDPRRLTLVSGAHESTGLMKSADGGTTWTTITGGITTWTNFPVVINANTFVVGASSGGGIWRTTNGGSNWSKVSSISPCWDPVVAANGTIYFLTNSSSVIKSIDQGTTWTSIPGSVPSGNFGPVEMPDGSIVTYGASTLVKSVNGASWIAIGSAYPSTPGLGRESMAYNSVAGSFFISFGNGDRTVSSNCIWKQDFAGTSPTNGKQHTNNSHSVTAKNMVVVTGASHFSFSNFKSKEIFNLFGRKVHVADQTGTGISIARIR